MKSHMDAVNAFVEEVINSAKAKGFDTLITVEGVTRYTGNIDRILYGPKVYKEESQEYTLADFYTSLKKMIVSDIGKDTLERSTRIDFIYQPEVWKSVDNESYYLRYNGEVNETNLDLQVIIFRGNPGNFQGNIHSDPITSIIYKDNGIVQLYSTTGDIPYPCHQVNIQTPLDHINFPYVFKDQHEIVRKLMNLIIDLIKNEEKESYKSSFKLLKHHITFYDFFKFLKENIKNDVSPYVFKENEENWWYFTQKSAVPDEYTLYYMKASTNVGYPVAGFRFVNKLNILKCYLIPYHTNRGMLYEYAEIFDEPGFTIPDGGIYVSMEEEKNLTEIDKKWHNAFNDYFSGEVIRLAIWTMLSM